MDYDGDDEVTDDEILYRSIQPNRNRYKVQDGRVTISSSAFLDVNFKPSVDRAKLHNNDPSRAQKHPDDGVTSLITQDIRAISNVVKHDRHQHPLVVYQVDVMADGIKNHLTLPDNPAHALIYTKPMCDTETQFDKLQRSLARLATNRGWLIPPADLREPAAADR